MQVVDRAIRQSQPAPSVPAAVRRLPTADLVSGVGSGALDRVLGPLHEAEKAGPARPSVLDAIAARSRVLRAEVP